MWIKSPEPASPPVPQRRFSAMDQDFLMVLATATDWSALSRVHTIEEKWSLLKTIIHLLTEAVVGGMASLGHG